MSNVLQTLRERGLLNDLTDPALEEILQKKQVTLYVGFDPTSDSLHIGNMVGILILRHFQLAGHRPIALVGGATGMIGDPSGKSDERNLQTAEQVAHNIAGIQKDLARILEFDGPNAAQLLNNGDWLGKFSFIDFLRDVGKNFRVGEMLGKESVRARLDSESGMSFTEFSYSLLQAYDFKHLYENHDCILQSGGSDQWGNIVSGIDLIRRSLGKQAYGMTTPLLVDSQGKKMGKSAGGAIFLNPEKVSVYDFYQFWVRQDDRDVERFLKMMTFLPLETIASVIAEHGKDPAQRVAQKRLALEVTTLVHGAEEAAKAATAASALFGGALSGKSDAELQAIFNDAPSVEIPRGELEAGLAIADALVTAKLVGSKKDAKRVLSQNGVYLNNGDTPWPAEERVLTPSHLASESMLILRTGKKNYCLVRFV